MSHHHQPSGLGIRPHLDPCQICTMPPAHRNHRDIPNPPDRSEPVHPRDEQND